jgi:ketosteroid isomerase-like protein
MSDQSPLDLVQHAYQAFGRGDVAAMLALMSDDFEWDSRYPAGVPIGGVWKGRDGVLSLLKTLSETEDVLAFAVQEFIAQGDKVVVLGFEEIRAKPTGRTYRNEWVHVWAVQDGQLARLRTYNDTAATVAAFV